MLILLFLTCEDGRLKSIFSWLYPLISLEGTDYFVMAYTVQPLLKNLWKINNSFLKGPCPFVIFYDSGYVNFHLGIGIDQPILAGSRDLPAYLDALPSNSSADEHTRCILGWRHRPLCLEEMHTERPSSLTGSLACHNWTISGCDSGRYLSASTASSSTLLVQEGGHSPRSLSAATLVFGSLMIVVGQRMAKSEKFSFVCPLYGDHRPASIGVHYPTGRDRGWSGTKNEIQVISRLCLVVTVYR